MTEVYISIDVESDGPCPGINSMLSLGAAIIDPISEKPVHTWEGIFQPLPDCKPNPSTMENFWNDPKNRAAWEAATLNPRDPTELIAEFMEWTRTIPGTKLFVCYPLSYDYKWLDYYIHRFNGSNPFGFACGVDLKSIVYGMGIGDGSFKGNSKKTMPRHWFQNLPKHTHCALDDAIEQGILFVRVQKDIERKRLEKTILDNFDPRS